MFGNGWFAVLFVSGISVLVMGIIFKMFPPKKINHIYGHRTPRAMKNKENWDFAQRHSATQFILSGITMITCSFLSFIFNQENENFVWVGTFLVVVILFAFVYRTARALKNFENKKS